MTLLHIQQYGNVFEVRVSTDQPLNAWSGRILLPSNVAVQRIAYGEGIGDIWQTPPVLSGREIAFAGGRTSSFAGDGLLFRFYSSASPGTSSLEPKLISFDATQTKLYAADGKGTPLAATLQPLTVNAKELIAASSSSWEADTVIPEPFTAVLVRDAAIFDGKEALVFSATDADSGIGRYEVEESTRYGKIGWHQAESPYLLGPDTEIVQVKAVDRAGNYRVQSIVIRQPRPATLKAGLFGGLLLLAAAAAVYCIYRWQKHR